MRVGDLVLSIFPGGGLLDYAFEAEGYTVVRGPDVIWGGDIDRFHPPQGRFDGVIGGDPCQSHSTLKNIVMAKGLKPSFPDMTKDFERIINQAQPEWFLRENIYMAPDVQPDGYDVRSFILDNSMLDSGDGRGHRQIRKRKFWFGVRDGECPELRANIDFALVVLPQRYHAVDGGHDHIDGLGSRLPPVTGRNIGDIATKGGDKLPRYTIKEMIELQGLPANWLDHQPWTVRAKRKMVGNGVAVPTGRALAKAIRIWRDRERIKSQ